MLHGLYFLVLLGSAGIPKVPSVMPCPLCGSSARLAFSRQLLTVSMLGLYLATTTEIPALGFVFGVWKLAKMWSHEVLLGPDVCPTLGRAPPPGVWPLLLAGSGEWLKGYAAQKRKALLPFQAISLVTCTWDWLEGSPERAVVLHLSFVLCC